MSLFDFFFKSGTIANDADKKSAAKKYVFVDTEVGLKDHKIHDIGALRYDGAVFHKNSIKEFNEFISSVDFICGHNIVHYDAKYLFGEKTDCSKLIDTLYWSPLLFPERPYHKLVKDDKLITDQINNPVNDCEKARELFFDEVAAWKSLSKLRRLIYSALLGDKDEFKGFLKYVKAKSDVFAFSSAIDEYGKTDYAALEKLIKEDFNGKICQNADIATLAAKYPCGTAYALALIDTTDHRSVTPSWVLYHYPEVEYVIHALRDTRCEHGCSYCDKELDINYNLKSFFGYDNFRTYNDEPLQQNAVQAAVDGKSLLAIFPTGGGKSLTFQLPALMAGRTVHGLTVIISPLQSLMKDQVDNLADKGITDAVTINGLLDPISRTSAIERVANGDASLLYIAPESLRSKTIERLLQSRNVVRFVIDEAHCFSAWGQDFRVDYLYIGKFIKEYQEKKGGDCHIPVSCFTATAKQKVVQDICDYFKKWLGTELLLFTSSASRTNLKYSVIHVESDDEKYSRLRSLVQEADGPTIIYVSRTKRTEELALRLTRDGMKALPFNGKMDPDIKVKNQDAFMTGEVNIIVATSAFGMGVDKSDVKLVIHYDISDSLENYVQEAGRAGRDPNMNANCYVLYGDNDLDKHFILLNQTKLSISEIQQVWQVIKNHTKQRKHICCSALEIARYAGWDDTISDIETRVRTALSALEQSGYIERGSNVPHVYATGITVKNMDEARKRITESPLFDKKEMGSVIRIIKSLISQKYIAKAGQTEAESRVDYLADTLGLTKADVVSAVERMRQEGILADTKDISAYILDNNVTQKKSKDMLERFARLEQYILNRMTDDTLKISSKQLNDDAQHDGVASSSEKDIRTLMYFLVVKGYTRKKEDASHYMEISRRADFETTIKRFETRIDICRFVINWLYEIANKEENKDDTKKSVQFSIVELLNEMRQKGGSLFVNFSDLQLEDVEEALLYLSKIGALKLEGGFLVLYNALTINRIKDTNLRYKKEDYTLLNEFYKQKIQQIHIVGEYANLMVSDYNSALQFVRDYFQMDYRKFVAKYFKGKRNDEISRNLTPAKYNQIFGQLSKTQLDIIDDHDSHYIVVAAGPGSGKTRVLVHKLASLLLLEDVKHEQLLMLTFSRAAATEFKQRLLKLIGNAAHFVEIKTFHSYCFDLLGIIGNLDESKDVVTKAAEMIEQGAVEPNRICKTVLVIDEAQDINPESYRLVKALMTVNETMRVIAVGDDDQCIFRFAGADPKFMLMLSKEPCGRFIEMTENYRSSKHIVDSANSFVTTVRNRIKSKPIISMSDKNGCVKLTRHTSAYMYEAVVNEVIKDNLKGKTCVLTSTNEEAGIIVAMLRKRGANCKLVQSMDKFCFYNIDEIKYFMTYIELRLKSPVIPTELWEIAKKETFDHYSGSAALEYVKRSLHIFEQTTRTKYYNDLRCFMGESSVEDFCDLSSANIVVSTIHKAKGTEFDNVYMMVGGGKNINDDWQRCYYVAMTRAKTYLSIHTNGDAFNIINADEKTTDGYEYGMPDEIMLQLTHSDVVLSYFKSKQPEIKSLRAGDKLAYKDFYLLTGDTRFKLAKLSQKMQKEIVSWQEKGYYVTEAEVRFIVAWKPKDAPKEEQETAIILANLKLSRRIVKML